MRAHETEWEDDFVGCDITKMSWNILNWAACKEIAFG